MPQNNLYLDEARIGRFRPQARKLYQSFLDFVADSPSSRNVLNFLIDGTGNSSSVNVKNQRSLKTWRGVNRLRESLAKGLTNTTTRDVYLASRSRALMQLGARMLTRTCHRCLSVDLNWPVYQHELTEEAKQVDCDIIVGRIQDRIIADRWDIDDICSYLSDVYARYRCDGLFLPAVDSMGIRLPIVEIVDRLRANNEVRFVVVDAAQALGHTDLSEIANAADFMVAGTHKWVGSYIPLGVGLATNPKSQQWIANFLNSAINTKSGDDSLMHMLHAIDNGRDTRFPETVNLGGLFAGYGAWMATPSPRSALSVRISNADCVASIAEYNGWNALRPDESLRTGSLVLPSTEPQTRKRDSDSLRDSFAEAGIVLSTYSKGIIRMAMPDQLFTTEQFLFIQSAFIHVDTPMRVAC